MSAELQAPLPGNVLQTVVDLGPEYGNDGRADTRDVGAAQVTTSMVDREGYGDLPTRVHRPVLDLDFPAQLVPSSTPGHFHLYLDLEVPHAKYMTLLGALADAGVIEPGYCGASQERGYTAVRLPWVKKEAAA